MRLAATLPMLPALLVCASAQAEPLPGLLDPDTVLAARREAAHQRTDAMAAIRRNARALGYPEAELKEVLTPTMARAGKLAIKLDDGTTVEFPWYRIGFAENILANTSKPVGKGRAETNKGGIRLHLGVFADEVYALALKMDMKLAVARDALGGHFVRGAKGGIGPGRVLAVGTRYTSRVGDWVDPASPVFDRAELMRSFADAYRATGGDVGPSLDIQAGDVNTKAPEMAVLAERYGSASIPSSGVSGKAVIRRADGTLDPMGGIEYRAVSTGEGVWMSARLAARRVGLALRGATVIAQGWGEVGRAFGLAAQRDGARVIAVQEVFTPAAGQKPVPGLLLSPFDGNATPRQVAEFLADVDALRAGADLATFKGGRYAPLFQAGGDASSLTADIVGVNALGGVLNDRTVPAYRASGTHQGKRKIIVEGANLAETAQGARLLDRAHAALLVVPGDLANVGGVHVSNLEAVQNATGQVVTDAIARRSLATTIRSAWSRAIKLADQRRVSERRAVELSAVDGMIKRSLHLRGAPKANLERRVRIGR